MEQRAAERTEGSGEAPPERLPDVWLKDVQADPGKPVRRLMRFIDPGMEDDAWVREGSAIPRPTSPKFGRLEASEQEALNEVCRPGLIRLGYTI